MSANGRRKQSFLKSCKILDEWYFYILYLQLSALADKIYSNTSKALIYTLSVYKAVSPGYIFTRLKMYYLHRRLLCMCPNHCMFPL